MHDWNYCLVFCFAYAFSLILACEGCVDIIDAQDHGSEITGTENTMCPFCWESFHSTWDALCHVCPSAAVPPQQQWTPSTKAACFKGQTLNSDGICTFVLDQVINYNAYSFKCFQSVMWTCKCIVLYVVFFHACAFCIIKGFGARGRDGILRFPWRRRFEGHG